jgi:medium-chain acyl-[acyl-carrier-protein] hydrolase
MFRQWLDDVPPEIEVWCVQLPGHEDRFREPALTSMSEIVPRLAAAILDQVRTPFALFGHSLGGLVIFETARWLRGHGGPSPVHLFVSGARAPQLWPATMAHTLDDGGLLQWMVGLGGIPEPVLADSELIQLLLPVVRADMTVCNTYRYQGGDPLSCPITAFAGDADPVTPLADVAAWADHTGAGFHVEVMRGGHFFLHEHRRALIGIVHDRLCGDRPADKAEIDEPGVRT